MYARTVNGFTSRVTDSEAGIEMGDYRTTRRKLVRGMSENGATTTIELRDGAVITLTYLGDDVAAEEEMPVKVNGDTISLNRPARTAHVLLAKGRNYQVSLDTSDGYADYWALTDGVLADSRRAARESDKPGSIGGRIWALLIAAGQV